MKPICYDLFTGLHGWLEAFLVEGYRCIGYDIEDMCASLGGACPAGIELRLRDVRSIHGSELKDAAVIVASPPCQAYSYRAMPWKRAKALPPPDNTLFNECFRIQREAIAATCNCACWRCKGLGHCVRCDCQLNTGKVARYIPLIVENVRGAQKWVGRAVWNYGSFYLWGDVPALMPHTFKRKLPIGNASEPMWKDRPIARLSHQNPSELVLTAAHVNDGRKHDGSGWTEKGSLKSHNRLVSNQLQSAAVEEMGIKQGGTWWGPEDRKTSSARFGSKSNARKAASAMIAKIPFPLAQHIARSYKPKGAE